MRNWRRARLDWLVNETRNTVDVNELACDTVFHYSIPALDMCGDGLVEPVEDIGSNKLLLHGGEILVSKLNPRISRVLTAERHSEPTIASTEFIAFTPRAAIDQRFLCYWLESESIRQFLNGATISVTRSQQRVRPDVLTKTWINVPPLTEQHAITSYLDIETARIDGLVAAKRRMVELLEERLRGAASEATHARSVADPAHRLPDGWKLRPLKRCLGSAVYGISEAAHAEGEYAVLGMTNISSGEVMGAPGGFVSVVDGDLLLAPGDLLFNRTNSRELVGKVGLVRSLDWPTTFASYLVRLRVNELADAQYLNYLLNAPEVLGLARSMALPSIGQANLNPNRYSAMVLPIPPVDEQGRCVARLDALASRTVDMRRTLERQVDLLIERRQALITAAVTGELDIPSVAA